VISPFPVHCIGTFECGIIFYTSHTKITNQENKPAEFVIARQSR